MGQGFAGSPGKLGTTTSVSSVDINLAPGDNVGVPGLSVHAEKLTDKDREVVITSWALTASGTGDIDVPFIFADQDGAAHVSTRFDYTNEILTSNGVSIGKYNEDGYFRFPEGRECWVSSLSSTTEESSLRGVVTLRVKD